MAVDMMMVGVTIAQMTNFDEEKTGPLFETVHQKLAQLRDEGIIVLNTAAAWRLRSRPRTRHRAAGLDPERSR